MGRSPGLSIVVDNPQSHYIPGDNLAGQVILESNDSIDVTDIGIELFGIEAVKYNKVATVNNLLSIQQALFTGPYTLGAGRNAYPFQFIVPATTDPSEDPSQIGEHRGDFQTQLKHTLPPSTNHSRTGLTYSFDAIIKYELFAWVKKPRMLGIGTKIALESRVEITFGPTICNSDSLAVRYQDHEHEVMVAYDSQHPADEKGNDKAKEEAKEQAQPQKRPGLFSKLFSSSSNPPLPNSAFPSERARLNILVPANIVRDRPNPLFLYLNYPPKTGIAPMKLLDLNIELKTIVTVPCYERTIYGAKPGRDEKIQVIRAISQDNKEKSLELPQDGEPLELDLFNDVIQQLSGCTGRFATFNVSQKFSLNLKYRLQSGRNKPIDVSNMDIPLDIPFPSTRPSP